MRIYQMTATFGKLEHQTLTLKPGLNVITAPNEWGKSTWCAFLMAMLYGLDTRAKSTRNMLADKDRYAPWSGSPMAGRVDLHWQGRDITIERRTKGRIPMGDFRAYETKSGLAVPELTAANCGQMLLGVEQSVYKRTGFLRLSDLPVTQDEALRRRLNALVTIGDESGAGDTLEQELKELKNRCRYNRSGLLPQAEAERAELKDKLQELEQLDAQCRKLKMQRDESEDWLKKLKNHRMELDYAAAEADAARVAKVRDNRDQTQEMLIRAEAACDKLPPKEEAEQKVRELRSVRDQWSEIQREKQSLPSKPLPPYLGEPFDGMDIRQAEEMVRQDQLFYGEILSSKAPLALVVLAALCAAAAGLLLALRMPVFAGIAVAVALVLLVLGLVKQRNLKSQEKELREKYGGSAPDSWMDPVKKYMADAISYQKMLTHFRELQGDLEVRLMVLNKKRESLCGDQEPELVLRRWQDILQRWENYHSARAEFQRMQAHLETLTAMAKQAKPPFMTDILTYSGEETDRLLAETEENLLSVRTRLDRYQGRMEALGDRNKMEARLIEVQTRIEQLEKTYQALLLALETLEQAKEELQRRFAPKIAEKARKNMLSLTEGRYDRVNMEADLSLKAGTAEETTLRDALWRSDGTVDQLYLALRLAVAGELIPDAPLVLDDALVRFDEKRLKAAMALLKKEAEGRQVILFSCQEREAKV